MKQHVLIYSSDPVARNAIETPDNGDEIEISCFADEADLILALLENGFGMVIYDLDDAKMNGVKTIRIIRRIRPKIPVMVLSNDVSKELGGKILQEGVTHYIVKPVDSAEIKQRVLATLANNKVSDFLRSSGTRVLR